MKSNNRFKNIINRQNEVKKYQPEYKKAGIQPNVAENVLIKGTSLPPNIRVNSGQNEGLAWTSKQKTPNLSQRSIDNNEDIIVKEVRERSFVNDNFEDGINKSVPISYDEVPDFTKSVVNWSEKGVEKDQYSESVDDFSSVEIGEFVLIFENEILGAGSYEEVTQAIEEILLSDKEGLISPKSLIVLKRMQILTGVLIKDV